MHQFNFYKRKMKKCVKKLENKTLKKKFKSIFYNNMNNTLENEVNFFQYALRVIHIKKIYNISILYHLWLLMCKLNTIFHFFSLLFFSSMI